MKVIYIGSNVFFENGGIYYANLDIDEAGEFYWLYRNGVCYDFCELNEVELVSDIRDKKINEILND